MRVKQGETRFIKKENRVHHWDFKKTVFKIGLSSLPYVQQRKYLHHFFRSFYIRVNLVENPLATHSYAKSLKFTLSQIMEISTATVNEHKNGTNKKYEKKYQEIGLLPFAIFTKALPLVQYSHFYQHPTFTVYTILFCYQFKPGARD